MILTEGVEGIDYGIYVAGNLEAAYQAIEPGVVEVRFWNYATGEEWVGHINQLEKAPGKCLYFLENEDIPFGWFSIDGECRCQVCTR